MGGSSFLLVVHLSLFFYGDSEAPKFQTCTDFSYTESVVILISLYFAT